MVAGIAGRPSPCRSEIAPIHRPRAGPIGLGKAPTPGLEGGAMTRPQIELSIKLFLVLPIAVFPWACYNVLAMLGVV